MSVRNAWEEGKERRLNVKGAFVSDWRKKETREYRMRNKRQQKSQD
jgi:hypothetical protein